MKYDDASWHFDGDFPAGSPIELGGIHIALLLKWCFLQGWAGEVHLKESAEEVEKVKHGEMTATKFLFDRCDGQFTDEDLTDAGNAFLANYYGNGGLYLSDYQSQFEDQMYVASEEHHDFGKFSRMVEARYKTFLIESRAAKPWWQFW